MSSHAFHTPIFFPFHFFPFFLLLEFIIIKKIECIPQQFFSPAHIFLRLEIHKLHDPFKTTYLHLQLTPKSRSDSQIALQTLNPPFVGICWHQVWWLALHTDWMPRLHLKPDCRLGSAHLAPESLEKVTATQISQDNSTAVYCILPDDLFLERYFRIKKYLPASLSDELLIGETNRTWPICFAWYCLILLSSHLELWQYISLIWFGFYLCSYLQFWIIIS